MDLLGSILSSMDAPPKNDDAKQREKKAKLAKLRKEEKKKKADFRDQIEKDVNEFIKDAKRTRHKFPPMNKIQRSIAHDVAEIAGLTTFSFGEDEVNRYVMLFKKDNPPPDEELEAYRNAEEYDPDAIKCKKLITQEKDAAAECSSSNMESVPPPSGSAAYWPSKLSTEQGPRTNNYKDKYKHLLGEDSGKAAARATKSNNSYGVVPSENKRDLRSIEETLNDIKKRKKLRRTDDDDSPDMDSVGE